MRIIAFDLSRHTGWAVMDGDKLVKSGHFDVIIENWKNDVFRTDQFHPDFPNNFHKAVTEIVKRCEDLVYEFEPDLIVTEFIEGSSHRFSQLFLDWIHMDFHTMIKRVGKPFKYVLNSDWRNHVKCWVSQHPDIARYNAKVGRAKAKAPKNKAGAKVAKIDGKVVSRIDQKKLSIMLASEYFGITLKSDDEADAVNLCRAAYSMWGRKNIQSV